MENNQKAPFLNGKVYDYTKFLAQVFLPALGTLYFALAGIWGLPSAQEVMGTILAVDAFLGVLLGLSQLQYSKSDAKYDGVMEIIPREDGSKTFSLGLNDDPHALIGKESVTFKVDTTPIE